jgi:AraC family transcriptional regulator
MRACDAVEAAPAAARARGGPRPSRSRTATHVIAGSVPDPLLTSHARGWDGVTVELHRFRALDTVVQPSDHVVAVHLAGDVSLRRTREGRTVERAMRAGDISITPVGPPVRWRQHGQSFVILMRLAPAFVRAIGGDECALDPDRFDLRDEFTTRDPLLEDIGHRLLAMLELEGTDGRLAAEALACELAIQLLREHTCASAAASWPKARLSPHKLRRAIEFIDANLRNDLTLASIADAIALSPGHFAHAFRAATGVAPHRYIVERRIERAKTLLRESDLPITEIADRIGCSSHSHFSVLFHRIAGFTPRQFRSLG